MYVYMAPTFSKLLVCVFIKKNQNVVVVVVFFTLTDRASTIPSNIRGCQSGTWSQRVTKVDGILVYVCIDVCI